MCVVANTALRPCFHAGSSYARDTLLASGSAFGGKLLLVQLSPIAVIFSTYCSAVMYSVWRLLAMRVDIERLSCVRENKGTHRLLNVCNY